jgi:16S rRNA (guanine527-N7)-methyltransferase
MKGSSAADEIAEHQAAVGRLGGGPASVVRCGVGVVEPPTTVVVIECVGRTRSGSASGSGSRSGSASSSGSGSGSRKAARTRR